MGASTFNYQNMEKGIKELLTFFKYPAYSSDFGHRFQNTSATPVRK